eukprot:CAMPEP_0113417504 /NCGR_PEP_ID=MMETSP0013_2-20120614/25687_1 /TAXON_ID=2843 ORGANISM="Skeletonema costatum, Strain 1716" /NCGR_SAMPLE_ID=MMETSP0013_2 /ASSEMBLY_ACC=CAM_ASM_000158 /LENGTH=260 /DNA_ID=CAMNT_0000304635 /DNA_START=12 /DNA_END=794 /DNA_ORIENTATION=- /assembly_acc=CAM_ASM_000158
MTTLPDMSTLSTSNNNNNVPSDDGVNPSDYDEDYIGDDSKYAFTTSAPATPLSSANKIAAMLAQHGVSKPRPFQLDAIFQLCIRRISMLYLIRKTGEGKSLVLKGMATIKRGITVCLVPLVGLGSDQVCKTTCTKCGVEAYHVDEWRGDRCERLMKRLSIFDPSKQHKSIVLFISPQQLGDGTQWCNLLKHLAKEGISAKIGRNGYFGTQDYATYVTVVTQSKPPLSHTMHPVPYSRRIFNESMCIMSKSTRRILAREAP